MRGRSQRGFSLVEMLVGVALMGMLMVAVIGVSFYLTRTYYQAEGLHRLQRQVVFGMEAIYQQLKVANEIRRDMASEVAVNDRVYTIFGLDYDPVSELTFQLPPVQIKYDSVERRLYIGGRKCADLIGGLAIEVGGELHEYQVTLSSVSRYGLVPTERLPMELSAKVRLRNYVVMAPAMFGPPDIIPELDGATISWRTNVQTIGEVKYRLWDPLNPPEWSTQIYDSYNSLHTVVIEGLDSGLTYEFRILGFSWDGLAYESTTYVFTTQEIVL